MVRTESHYRDPLVGLYFSHTQPGIADSINVALVKPRAVTDDQVGVRDTVRDGPDDAALVAGVCATEGSLWPAATMSKHVLHLRTAITPSLTNRGEDRAISVQGATP